MRLVISSYPDCNSTEYVFALHINWMRRETKLRRISYRRSVGRAMERYVFFFLSMNGLYKANPHRPRSSPVRRIVKTMPGSNPFHPPDEEPSDASKVEALVLEYVDGFG